MKRDKRKIKFAVGISGKSIIVSGMLMLVLLLVLALAGCRFSSEERLVKRSNLFETYRMPHVKEEEKKIFNFFLLHGPRDKGV